MRIEKTDLRIEFGFHKDGKRKESIGANSRKEGKSDVVATISGYAILSSNRAERLEKLKKLIESGFYKINHKAVAESIIEELLNG